jgi:hypothetical protein
MKTIDRYSAADLARLTDPAREALAVYQELAEQVVIDAATASLLEEAPQKGYLARGQGVVRSLGGESLGYLAVIAFNPADGTGDSTIRDFLGRTVLFPTIAESYPQEPKAIPREKTGIHSEVFMPLFTLDLGSENAEPRYFAGSLDELGLRRNLITKIAEVGQTRSTLVTDEKLFPISTFTVAPNVDRTRNGHRWGDPHAIFNAIPNLLQVGAFFAVRDEVAAEYSGLLRGLNPKMPDGWKS